MRPPRAVNGLWLVDRIEGIDGIEQFESFDSTDSAGVLKKIGMLRFQGLSPKNRGQLYLSP